jgi:hypothetical protein
VADRPDVGSVECGVGKKHGGDDPQAVVRKLIKAGKVKKKCCTSKPRCKKCPVRALKKAKSDVAKAA